MNWLTNLLLNKFREPLRSFYHFSKRFSSLHNFLQRIYLKRISHQEFVFPKNKKAIRYSNLENLTDFVLIDAQCLQSGSFNRGIGRYSRMLVISLAKLHPTKFFVLFFNSLELENTVEEIVQSFPSEIKNIKFHTSRVEIKNVGMQIQELAEKMSREIEELDPELLLALSVVEHPSNVIPLNPRLVRNSICILYDVIPLQFPNIFLESSAAKDLYHENLSRLLRYSKIASISDKSIENLHKFFPEVNNIAPIYGAGFEDPLSVVDERNFSSRKGFIAVGSASPHKNLRNVLSAYLNLPREVRNSHPLHLVGVGASGEKLLLRQFGEKHGINLLVHDFLTEEQLNSLYAASRIAIAPAWEEGLGMPVFESWFHGAICIGSQDTAISEILGSSEVCFDPLDPDSISATMNKYIENEEAWAFERKRVAIRSEAFSWQITAKKLSDFARLT